MLHLAEVAALRSALAEQRGKGRRIALVPTMGNLHAGHLKLVARARAAADFVVVSVFVNPLQFGPNEDFDRYPRTLAADAEKLAAAGADLMFAPPVEQVYPNGYPPSTTVCMRGEVVETLEGALRPGHFDGVSTVVCILFNLVRPDVAVFGEKDWQQLAVIRRMNADLGLGIEILGEPTQRDADGLALSSRNQYLSAAERGVAPLLRATLCQVADALRDGMREFSDLQSAAELRLSQGGFRPQYVAVRAPDLGPPRADAREWVVLAAAHLGTTRLIDNIHVVI